jgi:glycerol-3-phosphate dehydrogenase (NAD+)
LGGLIDVSVLSGANIASEVARERFCEATLGCSGDLKGATDFLVPLFATSYFHITVVRDAASVELFGAIKNVVALGAGFSDGLAWGDNAKAAVIRLGLLEMRRFARIFAPPRVGSYDPSDEDAVLLQSCGVADLVTTCYGGRNRRVAEAMVVRGLPLETLEREMLGGQKLQGTQAACAVHAVLTAADRKSEFPLLEGIYAISFQSAAPETMMDALSASATLAALDIMTAPSSKS